MASKRSAHMNDVNAQIPARAVRSQRRGPRKPEAGRSVAETYPAIAGEWDLQANYPLTPSDVSIGSAHQAVWTCPKGHVAYRQRVEMRTQRGMGCPACGRVKSRASHVNRAPKSGKSLAEVFPELAAEWDYEANYPLTPADVAGRSNKKAYFRCPRGHGSHEAYISNRAAGHRCPRCASEDRGPELRRRNLLRNCLALSAPGLAAEWNKELNAITPKDIVGACPEKRWWNCPSGHAPYEATVRSRFYSGTGCPMCAREVSIAILNGYRYTGPEAGSSLGDVHPELIASWDVERNGGLTAFEVAPKSHRNAHWLCPAGHSFQREVRDRVRLKMCPVCRAGQKAVVAT